MYKFKQKISGLLLLVVLIWHSSAIASTSAVNSNLYKNIRFTKVDIPHFPKDIKCVAQDSSGFMWFAADGYGLLKYNGTTFKQYVQNIEDPKSLSNDYVKEILIDSRGLTWIATRGNISLYNEQQDFFDLVLPGNLYFNQLGNIIEIKEDKQGNIIAKCHLGFVILKIDQLDPLITSYSLYPLFDKSADFGVIQNYCADKYNNIIVTTGKGSFVKLHSDTVFKEYLFGFELPISQYQALDKNCNCFVADEGVLKIFRYDSLSYHHAQTLSNYQWTQGRENVAASTPNYFNGIYWMHTRRGLDVLILSDDLTETKAYYHYQSDKTNDFTIPANLIQDICADKDNVVWVSTTGGLSIFEPSGIQFEYFQTRDFEEDIGIFRVRSFYQFNSQYIWIGSMGKGLFLLNLENNYITRVPTNIVPEFNTIDWLTSTNDNNLWLSVGDNINPGVYKLNIEKGFYNTKDFSQLTLSKLQLTDIGFSANINKPVTYVNYDRKGNFWVGCNNFGLLRIAVEKGEPIKVLNHYQSEMSDKRFVYPNSSIHDMCHTKSGNYVFATRTMGFFVIDSNYHVDTIFTDAGLNNNGNGLKINMVYEDDNENIWVATNGMGVVQFSPDFTRKERYTTKNGLSSNLIFSILQDNQKHIWVNTNRGLSKLTNNKKGFTLVNTSYDGSERNFFGPYFKDMQGSLYYVHDRFGIVKMNFIDMVKVSNTQPTAVFTDLHINNKLITVGDTINNILAKALNYTKRLHLQHFQNNVTIGFASLSYPTSLNCNYRYMMEGIDDNWIETSYPVNYANYSKLPGGNYTFKLFVTNNKGVWCKSPKILNVYIKPVFYATTWFKLLMVFMFFFIVVFVYYLRINAVRLRNVQLEKLVQKRTSEISQSNLKLQQQADQLYEANTLLEERQQHIEEQAEELRSQAEELTMQKEQLEISINTKNTLFSIIAHDIKNPFNTLLGFTEVLKLKSANASREKLMRYIDIIFSSSKSIYRLLDNLLQWSRAQLGTISIDYQVIGLTMLLKDIEELLSDQFLIKQNKLALNFEDDFKLISDYNILNSILRNIINNANKYTDKGSITVSAEKTADFVKIMVNDNGVGIAEEIRNELFKIKKGKSQSGTSGESGTGLGLIVCKDFMEILGGKIEVESELGKGSTFILTFPNNQKI